MDEFATEQDWPDKILKRKYIFITIHTVTAYIALALLVHTKSIPKSNSLTNQCILKTANQLLLTKQYRTSIYGFHFSPPGAPH